MPASTKTILIWSCAAFSLVWITATSIYFFSGWDRVTAEAEEERLLGIQNCAFRYSDPAAKDRCDIIFNLLHTQDIAKSLANRALGIFALPLIAYGCLYFLVIRKKSAKQKRRKSKKG